MKTLRRFLMRAASATRRRDEERLREELEQHLALQTAENLRAGLSPVEARRQAVLKFGAVEAIKEHYRDEHGLPVLDSLVRDVRYGIRALLRSPGFALVAVVSLALGIGANTTIFSVANAVLYRPLPFDDPDRLVVIHEQNTKRESQRVPTLSAMIEWQEQARSFEQIEGIVWSAETIHAVGGRSGGAGTGYSFLRRVRSRCSVSNRRAVGVSPPRMPFPTVP